MGCADRTFRFQPQMARMIMPLLSGRYMKL
jgi:hypothetical protein